MSALKNGDGVLCAQVHDVHRTVGEAVPHFLGRCHVRRKALGGRHAALTARVAPRRLDERVFVGIHLVVAHAHHHRQAGRQRLHEVEELFPNPRPSARVANVSVDHKKLVRRGCQRVGQDAPHHPVGSVPNALRVPRVGMHGVVVGRAPFLARAHSADAHVAGQQKAEGGRQASGRARGDEGVERGPPHGVAVVPKVIVVTGARDQLAHGDGVEKVRVEKHLGARRIVVAFKATTNVSCAQICERCRERRDGCEAHAVRKIDRAVRVDGGGGGGSEGRRVLPVPDRARVGDVGGPGQDHPVVVAGHEGQVALVGGVAAGPDRVALGDYGVSAEVTKEVGLACGQQAEPDVAGGAGRRHVRVADVGGVVVQQEGTDPKIGIMYIMLFG